MSKVLHYVFGVKELHFAIILRWVVRKAVLVGLVLVMTYLLERYIGEKFVGKSGEIFITCIVDHFFFGPAAD